MSTDGAFSPLTLDAAAHAAALATAAPNAGQTGIVLDTSTARVAQLSDAFSYIRFMSAAPVLFTIPSNAAVPFPINSVIEFEGAGIGGVTVVAGALPGGGNVTILSRGADMTLAGQYSVAAIRKVDTDTWVLTGDL